MTNFVTTLSDNAAAIYSTCGRFARHFARGKLKGDPVFAALLERGMIPDDSHILDLGCGQGLLAAWLLAARRLFDAGQWPEGWPPPPTPASMRGVELMPREVERARRALGASAQFVQGDIRTASYGTAGTVVILDVLHFLDHADQRKVLERVRDALAPTGVLLMRIGDAAGGWGFHFSTWVDRFVAFCRGRSLSPLHCRPLAEWRTLLAELGFQVEDVPMSRGTPFSNILLRASLGGIQPNRP